MATIIAGLFDTIGKAEGAVRDLLRQHCSQKDISTFYNSPPGQHGTYPVGGDEDVDPGAKGAEKSAAKGAVAGAAGLGLAAAVGGPLAAAAAAGVGAYTGSLSGALSGVGDDASKDSALARRPAGVVVAVNASPASEKSIVKILRERGAKEVEKAEGQWWDGEWVDFNPVAAPRLVPDD